MYFVRAACDAVIRLNDVFFVVVFFNNPAGLPLLFLPAVC